MNRTYVVSYTVKDLQLLDILRWITQSYSLSSVNTRRSISLQFYVTLNIFRIKIFLNSRHPVRSCRPSRKFHRLLSIFPSYTENLRYIRKQKWIICRVKCSGKCANSIVFLPKELIQLYITRQEDPIYTANTKWERWKFRIWLNRITKVYNKGVFPKKIEHFIVVPSRYSNP